MCCCRIMGTFVFVVLMPLQVFFAQAKTLGQKLPGKFTPALVLLNLHARRNKVLHFHLFKFTYAENKVTRANFITESFTHLRDSKWNLTASSLAHVFVVGKNASSSFWTQIRHRAFILNRANPSFHHHVVVTWLSKGLLATLWTSCIL